MSRPSTSFPSQKSLSILSRLLFPPVHGDASVTEGLNSEIKNISRDDFDDLVTLANLNHVVIRGLEVFLQIVRDANDEVRAEWAVTALAAERARIDKAIPFLYAISVSYTHLDVYKRQLLHGLSVRAVQPVVFAGGEQEY